MPRAPLIGVASELQTHAELPDKDRNELYGVYTDAILRAGGIPVVAAVSGNVSRLEQLYDRLDGVMLPGSDDIPPSRFGDQEPHPTLILMPEIQYDWWAAMVELAARKPKPLLALCGGMQVVNVALGGSLIQDIPSQTESTVCHHSQTRPDATHEVEIDPQSRLATILGGTHFTINSAHHEALDRVPDRLTVTARCPGDEIVEAVEMPDHPFFVAVQWHPERFFEGDTSRLLFESFVTACRRG